MKLSKENRIGRNLALAWLLLVGAAAILWPLYSAKGQAMHFDRVLHAPGSSFLLGSDALGRDLLARLGGGAAVSLSVSVVAVLISVLVGSWLGAWAGLKGGLWDRALSMLIDIFLCFPVFFLILAVIAIVGPGLFNVAVVIGLTSWMGTARLVRAEVMSLKSREFVLASRVLGAGDGWILGRHLLPNALGPIAVNSVLGLSHAILIETGLSFLGLGVQPPTPSWGNLLSDGKSTLGLAWWMTLFPGLAIFFTVLSVNTLGERMMSGLKGRRTT